MRVLHPFPLAALTAAMGTLVCALPAAVLAQPLVPGPAAVPAQAGSAAPLARPVSPVSLAPLAAARPTLLAPLAADAPVPPARHCSSLARYRSHRDTTVTPWVEANETVARIGGWRSYQREAGAAAPAASASAPAASRTAPACAEPAAAASAPARSAP
jgi:hypothetical protein